MKKNNEDLKIKVSRSLEKVKDPYKNSLSVVQSYRDNLAELEKKNKAEGKPLPEKLVSSKDFYTQLILAIDGLNRINNKINDEINNMGLNNKDNKIIIEVYKKYQKELQENLSLILKKANEIHDAETSDEKIAELDIEFSTTQQEYFDIIQKEYNDPIKILQKYSENFANKIQDLAQDNLKIKSKDTNFYKTMSDIFISYNKELSQFAMEKPERLENIHGFKVLNNNFLIYINSIQKLDQEIQLKINQLSKNKNADEFIIEIYKDQRKDLQQKLKKDLRDVKEFYNNEPTLGKIEEFIKKLENSKKNIDQAFKDYASKEMPKKATIRIIFNITEFENERKKAYGAKKDFSKKSEILGILKNDLNNNALQPVPETITKVIKNWKTKNTQWENILKERPSIRQNFASKFGIKTKTTSEKFIEKLEKNAKSIDEVSNSSYNSNSNLNSKKNSQSYPENYPQKMK